MESPETALNSGKEAYKPVVLFFADDTSKSRLFEQALSHPFMGRKTFDKVAYGKVEFKKESPLCKEWKVTSAPTLLLIDNTGEKPKLIKKYRTGSPPAIRAAIVAAARKLEKKKKR